MAGLGHVPSFKNTKDIKRNNKTGKPFIATNDKKKAWMDRAIQSFECQLRSECQTPCPVTSTARPAPSSIASRAPLDDSWKWIPELSVRVERVEAGQEGAEITIERLPY